MRFFSENFNSLLKSRGFSQMDFCRATKIDTILMHRILSHQNENSSLNTVKAIADFFNVTMDSLVHEAIFCAEEI
jgi:transcriptional regulator with XRE-family HTH domain